MVENLNLVQLSIREKEDKVFLTRTVEKVFEILSGNRNF